MQPNQIFVTFLCTLCGFIKISNNSVLHIATNQIITAHTEPEWLKVEFPLNEMLIVEMNKDKFHINYKLVVDSYIAFHCQIANITKDVTQREEFMSCKSILQSNLDSSI